MTLELMTSSALLELMTIELTTSSALLELMTPPRVPLGNRPPPLDACISDRDYQPSSHAPPPSSGVAGWPAERSRWSSRTPALTPRLGRRRRQCNLEVNLLEDARGPVAATTDRHVGRWRLQQTGTWAGGGYNRQARGPVAAYPQAIYRWRLPAAEPFGMHKGPSAK
jgi:hypothetical protein